MATLNDLTVYRRRADFDSPEVFEVSSWLTRGRCATVYKSKCTNAMTIQPFLIPSYMQGITDALLREAVVAFLETEEANAGVAGH